MRPTYFFGITALLAAVTTTAIGAQAELPLGDLLASADQAWIAGKYPDALARYQAVLRRDSTSARAVFRVATMLGWRNDLALSVSLFRYYLHLAPGDDDGRVALARSLAWSGRYAEAIALSDSVLSDNPRQRDAAMLSAQALAWSGSPRAAIARYQRWLSAHADASDGAGTPHSSRIEPVAGVRVSGRIASHASLGAGVTRAMFDETAPLIFAAIATTSIDADGDYTIRPRLSFGGGGSFTRLTGG